MNAKHLLLTFSLLWVLAFTTGCAATDTAAYQKQEKVSSPEEQAALNLMEMAGLYRIQSATAMMRFVSPDYYGNYNKLQDEIRDELDTYHIENLRLVIDETSLSERFISIKTHWYKIRSDRKTGVQTKDEGVTSFAFTSGDPSLLIQTKGDVLFGAP
jgi:hypothetical protein